MKGSRFFPFVFILVSCDVCSFLFLFLLAIFSISVKCSNFFLTIFYLYLLFHARLFVTFNDAVTNLQLSFQYIGEILGKFKRNGSYKENTFTNCIKNCNIMKQMLLCDKKIYINILRLKVAMIAKKDHNDLIFMKFLKTKAKFPQNS